MSKKSIKEHLKQVYRRYRESINQQKGLTPRVKQMILNEFCANTDYNRKYVIRLLNGPLPADKVELQQRKRGSVYGSKGLSVLAAIWTVAGSMLITHKEVRIKYKAIDVRLEKAHKEKPKVRRSTAHILSADHPWRKLPIKEKKLWQVIA